MVGSKLAAHSYQKLFVPLGVKVFPSFLEPLYQYLNHIEFGGTPVIPRTESASSTSSNQLELARQLSFSHRKLWCEQPEVSDSCRAELFLGS